MLPPPKAGRISLEGLYRKLGTLLINGQDPNTLVYTEGCDCIGPSDGAVTVDTVWHCGTDPIVIIGRGVDD